MPTIGDITGILALIGVIVVIWKGWQESKKLQMELERGREEIGKVDAEGNAVIVGSAVQLIQPMKDKIEQLTKEIKLLSEQLKTLESMLSAKDAEILKLNLEMQNLLSKIDLLESKLTYHEKQLDATLKENINLREEIKKLKPVG